MEFKNLTNFFFLLTSAINKENTVLSNERDDGDLENVSVILQKLLDLKINKI